jgi:hypothetical protein
LTADADRATLATMTPRPPDDRSDELPPAEAARARRRDHDAAAAARSGMRTGLAKQFKQVLDAQVKRGRAAATGGVPGATDEETPDEVEQPEARPRKRDRESARRHRTTERRDPDTGSRTA